MICTIELYCSPCENNYQKERREAKDKRKGNCDIFFSIEPENVSKLDLKLAVNLKKCSHTQIKKIHPLKMISEILPQCFSAYAVFKLCIFIFIFTFVAPPSNQRLLRLSSLFCSLWAKGHKVKSSKTRTTTEKETPKHRLSLYEPQPLLYTMYWFVCLPQSRKLVGMQQHLSHQKMFQVLFFLLYYEVVKSPP